jgi:hypothetical protein
MAIILIILIIIFFIIISSSAGGGGGEAAEVLAFENCSLTACIARAAMAPPQLLHLVAVIHEVDAVLMIVSLEERPELNPEKHFLTNNSHLLACQ